MSQAIHKVSIPQALTCASGLVASSHEQYKADQCGCHDDPAENPSDHGRNVGVTRALRRRGHLWSTTGLRCGSKSIGSANRWALYFQSRG